MGFPSLPYIIIIIIIYRSANDYSPIIPNILKLINEGKTPPNEDTMREKLPQYTGKNSP